MQPASMRAVVLANRKVPVGEGIAQKTRTLAPLTEFLIALAASYGAIKKDQLRTEADAAGYPEAKNGRAFHFVLMNITKAHKLHQLPDGRYANPNPPSLSELFAPPKTEEAAMRTLM